MAEGQQPTTADARHAYEKESATRLNGDEDDIPASTDVRDGLLQGGHQDPEGTE